MNGSGNLVKLFKNKGMLNNCEAKGLGCVLTLPIYRGREQHGNGREAGDEGTGSGRVRYGRREALTPLSPPTGFARVRKNHLVTQIMSPRCLYFFKWNRDSPYISLPHHRQKCKGKNNGSY